MSSGATNATISNGVYTLPLSGDKAFISAEASGNIVIWDGLNSLRNGGWNPFPIDPRTTNREAQDIAERKKTLAAMLANVAELGAGLTEETVGKVGCRDAAIVTGIATDKMLALTGQTPVSTQVAVIQMPTPKQDEARRRADHALDEITRLLHKQEPLSDRKNSCSKRSAAFCR